ncbi:hypothetical protein MMC20_004640 [Loxospora ochrophaea]|nr:hypothetical protein [Loxospora ochrophaea]
MSHPTPAYDQVLVDIVHYVYHARIDSALAWQRAKVALLDALGCAMESLVVSPDVLGLIGPLVPDTVVPNGARVPGTQHIVDPIKAAFDIATLIRYLDHNDAYPGREWGHPSDNLGAIIAVLDWLSREAASNQGTRHTHTGPARTLGSLLEAQIKAYEIQGSLQQLNAFNAVGLDHVVLVKVASAAVVSWLVGLSEAEALAALSQAWQDGHPIRTYRQAPNTSPRKGWAAGDACMRAVFLVLLTKKGQPGAPTVLTAPKWGFYASMFRGKEFQLEKDYGSHIMETLFFKLIPAEGHGISAVEAAVTLAHKMKASSTAVEDIKAIRIRTQRPGNTIINKVGPLHNPADRDHCIQYMVAVALLKGDFIETSDYNDDSPWVKERQVDQLREKTTVTEDPNFSRDYFDPKVRSGANGVELEFQNGSTLEEVVEYPIGHPNKEETISLVRKKYRLNLARKLTHATIELIEKNVDDTSMPVNQFMDLFTLDSEEPSTL